MAPFEREYPPYDIYSYENYTITEEIAIHDYYNLTVTHTDEYETLVRKGFMRIFCENNETEEALSDGINHCKIIKERQ